MREKLRTARLLVGFAFRVDPWRSTGSIVLVVLGQLAGVSAALAFKVITDAAVHGDSSRAYWGVALLIASVSFMLSGAWGAFVLFMGLGDRVALAIDTELARLSDGLVGIEHLERPDYLARIDYIRNHRHAITYLPSTMASLLAVSLRLALTVVVLAEVAPVLAFLPLFGLPTLAATWWRTRALAGLWDNEYGRLNRLQETIRRLGGTEPSGREIRVFGLQEEVQRRYDDALEQGDQLWRRASIRGALAQVGAWGFFGAAFVGSLALVAHQAVTGHLSAGDVVLVVTLAAQLNARLGVLAGHLNGAGGSMRTGQRLLWLVDHAANEAAGRGDRTPPATLRQGIELRGLTFRYPDTDADVLRDVDLALPAGSTVAIVGDNGAGKTTLVKLLLRMYEPDSGGVFLDGVDVREFDLLSFRDRTSAAFQDFARLEFTAQHSVGVGRLADLDDDLAVRAALDRAHGADVIDDLPDGLDSQLGRNFAGGSQLSGGQWQKLALGRAMMRPDPLLLVLDEPTASLDAITEEALFERFAGAARRASQESGGITVIVSHRFSTVRMADLIIVVDAGNVIEFGSHAELMAAGGTYAELFELQASSYR